MIATTKLFGSALIGAALLMVATLGFVTTQSGGDIQMNRFSSEYELRLFLTNQKPDTGGGPYPSFPNEDDARLSLDERASHSTTNIQVAGVDEADTVKTDGECIFVGSYSNVTIIKAYPPNSLEILSTIEIEELELDVKNISQHLEGLFINDDRLVLIVSSQVSHPWDWLGDVRSAESASYVDYEPPKTTVAVYDVSDRMDPSFVRSFAVSGYYLSSRMIGDSVYLITQSHVWSYADEITLPYIWRDDSSREISAKDIRYDPDTPQASTFLNMLAVDVDTGENNVLSIVAGWASVIYVSPNAIYFTVQKYRGDIEWVNGVESPEDESSAVTTIYKVRVEALSMWIAGSGDVNGWLLNQFSMDESHSRLRVATTTDWWSPENAVYVLDSSMKVIGKLEELAPFERIYSSRFVGDTLYLVTFRQTDPFFVIDLSDPFNPSVMGELVIPGFSNYLHPVDEDHVLGIGLESGRLKVSLFNTSDPANPQEQSKYIFESSWHTDALYDHKAVLFDYERQLLVIPGSCYNYDSFEGIYEHMTGALVIDVSLSDGISLRGIVIHDTNESSYWSQDVQRSLYIEDFLYTISQKTVQVNLLDDLSYIDSLVYYENPGYYWYMFLA